MMKPKEALELIKKYADFPRTLPGLKSAGIRAGFLCKIDGFHWGVDRAKLMKYLEDGSGITPIDLADRLNTARYDIYNTMRKLNIELETANGRKYIRKTDAEKIAKCLNKRYSDEGSGKKE